MNTKAEKLFGVALIGSAISLFLGVMYLTVKCILTVVQELFMYSGYLQS